MKDRFGLGKEDIKDGPEGADSMTNGGWNWLGFTPNGIFAAGLCALTLSNPPTAP